MSEGRKMTDVEVERKLDKLVKLCNELDEEAQRRWGENAGLFYADNHFNMMRDAVGPDQDTVELYSMGICKLSSGAW